MVAFFRQFLVVLLVLLQNAAPLMHAHTGREGTESGLHLFEFEDLRLAADRSTIASANFAHDTEYCIVSVGSAIKQAGITQKTKLFFGLISHTSVSIHAKPTDCLEYSRFIAGFIPYALLNPHSPRAPPFLQQA